VYLGFMAERASRKVPASEANEKSVRASIDLGLKQALRGELLDEKDVFESLERDRASLTPAANDDEVEIAWAAEIERRARRVLAGGSEGMDWNQARDRIALIPTP
jgi:hypothetical protein